VSFGSVGVLLATFGLLLSIDDLSGPGIPLLVGAAAAFALAILCRSDRHRLLVRLVAQGDAWTVDGVSELAERLGSPRERRRLAQGLRAAAAAGMTGAQTPLMVSAARASDVADRLVALAEALADPAVRVSPPAAALCRRLLSDAMYSPLYNPHVPERELPRVLDVVERGVS
jgi:hypothetical protein